MNGKRSCAQPLQTGYWLKRMRIEREVPMKIRRGRRLADRAFTAIAKHGQKVRIGTAFPSISHQVTASPRLVCPQWEPCSSLVLTSTCSRYCCHRLTKHTVVPAIYDAEDSGDQRSREGNADHWRPRQLLRHPPAGTVWPREAGKPQAAPDTAPRAEHDGSWAAAPAAHDPSLS